MLTIESIFSNITSFFYPENTPLDVQSENPIVSDMLGISEESVLSTWTPERPQLTPPESLPSSRGLVSTLRLLNVTDQSRELGDSILETLALRLSNVKEDIRTISAENMKKLKEAAERANASNFWSTLQKIATCLLSALSIVFGVAIAASGGGALIGGAMIASGVLSLANFALSEFGTWDWVADQLAHGNEENKRIIAMILPAAIGIVAGGIGMVGSVHGVATGALQFAEKAVFVAQTAVTLFGAATTLGKGIADARLLWTQADLLKIQAELAIERENFTTPGDEIQGSMNDFKAVKSKTQKAIDMITQSDIQLVRQG
jgi:hypothetical protein